METFHGIRCDPNVKCWLNYVELLFGNRLMDGSYIKYDPVDEYIYTVYTIGRMKDYIARTAQTVEADVPKDH